jgi:hypothetical protein
MQPIEILGTSPSRSRHPGRLRVKRARVRTVATAMNATMRSRSALSAMAATFRAATAVSRERVSARR